MNQGPRTMEVAVVALLGVAVGLAAGFGKLAWVAIAALIVCILVAGLARSERGGLGPENLALLAIAGAVGGATATGARLAASITYGDLFFVFAALLFVALLMTRPQMTITAPWWLLAAGGGLLACGLLVEISPPHSIDSTTLEISQTSLYNQARGIAGEVAGNLDMTIRFVGTLVVVPLLIGSLATSWRKLSFVVDVWLIAIALSCAIAVTDVLGITPELGKKITGAEYELPTLTGEATRQAGLAIHPVLLALAAGMAMPVALARAVSPDVKHRLWYLGIGFTILLGVLASGSRSGVGAIAVAFVLFPLLFQGQARRQAIVVLASIAAIALIAGMATGNLVAVDRIFSSSGDAENDSFRIKTIRQGINQVVHRPIIGNGFEFLRGAHSLYVQIAQAGGLPALAFFLLFVAGALRLGWLIARNSRAPPEMHLLARALMISMSVWLITGLLQNPILDRFLYIPAGALLALGVVVARLPRAVEEPEPIDPAPSRPPGERVPAPVVAATLRPAPRSR